MIPVTKPFSPPIEEYKRHIDGIWERNWFTNNGPLVLELEKKLRQHLDLQQLLFLGNGTIAIQIAIKALELKGEIITTPFSYVATTSSIVWENCVPVFADIDEETLNISPASIEACITEKTTAILATHVYGNPCDIDAIDALAKKHGLKVIYDAAHCFGTLYKGRSVFGFGDVSTTSFHATKLFHTIEGGAVFSTDEAVHARMSYMRNFGHNGPVTFAGLGINGKNSEFHAAMGLVNLNYIAEILEKRQLVHQWYDRLLQGKDVRKPAVTAQSTFNYSYYPLVFPSEEILLQVIDKMQQQNIFPRRYFYPTLSSLHYVTNPYKTPIADAVSKRVICLPLFHTITEEEVMQVSQAIQF
jgi:dTDP-4-amino-4,6-dideoxygalactose transaminase